MGSLEPLSRGDATKEVDAPPLRDGASEGEHGTVPADVAVAESKGLTLPAPPGDGDKAEDAVGAEGVAAPLPEVYPEPAPELVPRTVAVGMDDARGDAEAPSPVAEEIAVGDGAKVWPEVTLVQGLAPPEALVPNDAVETLVVVVAALKESGESLAREVWEGGALALNVDDGEGMEGKGDMDGGAEGEGGGDAVMGEEGDTGEESVGTAEGEGDTMPLRLPEELPLSDAKLEREPAGVRVTRGDGEADASADALPEDVPLRVAAGDALPLALMAAVAVPAKPPVTVATTEVNAEREAECETIAEADACPEALSALPVFEPPGEALAPTPPALPEAVPVPITVDRGEGDARAVSAGDSDGVRDGNGEAETESERADEADSAADSEMTDERDGRGEPETDVDGRAVRCPLGDTLAEAVTDSVTLPATVRVDVGAAEAVAAGEAEPPPEADIVSEGETEPLPTPLELGGAVAVPEKEALREASAVLDAAAVAAALELVLPLWDAAADAAALELALPLGDAAEEKEREGPIERDGLRDVGGENEAEGELVKEATAEPRAEELPLPDASETLGTAEVDSRDAEGEREKPEAVGTGLSEPAALTLA